MNSWPKKNKKDSHLYSSSGIIKKIKNEIRKFGEINSVLQLRFVINEVGENFQTRLPKYGQEFYLKLKAK